MDVLSTHLWPREEKNTWNVLSLLNCPLPNRKPTKGVRVGKRDNYSGQAWSEGVPLVIPGHFSENVHFLCPISFRAGDWHIMESVTGPNVSATREV